MPSVIGKLFKTKKLPTGGEIKSAAGRAVGGFVRNPVRAIRTGIQKDRAAVDALKQATGLTRGQAVGQVAKSVYNPNVARKMATGMAANTGAGIGATVGGLPGAAAGAVVGKTVANRGITDVANVSKAVSGARKSPTFRRQNPITQGRLIRRRANRLGKTGAEAAEEITDVGVENIAENAPITSAMPFGGDIAAKAVADPLHKGITFGAKKAQQSGNIGTGIRAGTQRTGRLMRRRFSGRGGKTARRYTQRRINRQLGQNLPDLPPGVDFTANLLNYIAEFSETATKTNPQLWESVKSEAKQKLGGHSARAMQLASKLYKQRGGGYKGKKSSSNSLKKWTSADWGYINPKDNKKPKEKRGRYLPKKIRDNLSKKEKANENAKKRLANKLGKSKATYSNKLAKRVSKTT